VIDMHLIQSSTTKFVVGGKLFCVERKYTFTQAQKILGVSKVETVL